MLESGLLREWLEVLLCGCGNLPENAATTLFLYTKHQVEGTVKKERRSHGSPTDVLPLFFLVGPHSLDRDAKKTQTHDNLDLETCHCLLERPGWGAVLEVLWPTLAIAASLRASEYE